MRKNKHKKKELITCNPIVAQSSSLLDLSGLCILTVLFLQI